MLQLNKLFSSLHFSQSEFNLNHNALKETFGDEYETYLKIKEWFKGKQIENKKVSIYYPGCGRDMATLLMICDAIISPKNNEIEVIMLDIRDFFDGIIYEIEKYTKKPKITRKEFPDKYVAEVFFKAKKFKITYYVNDVSAIVPDEIRKGFDIYYERAFEMFRSHNGMMLYRILKCMKKLGLAISDYGFDFGSHKDSFKKLNGIPTQFGLHNKFQIWQKIK